MSDGIRVVRAGTQNYNFGLLAHGFTGQPYLAIPWPTDAPAPWNDPACALREWVWSGRYPVRVVAPPSYAHGRWWVPIWDKSHSRVTEALLHSLTPADEPKRCHGCGLTNDQDPTVTMRTDCEGVAFCNDCHRKRCEHPEPHFGTAAYTFRQCPSCGTILSDRRKEQRRKGERRVVGDAFGGGGRRVSVGRRYLEDRRGDR
jgi:hypothetical protein